MLIGNFGTRSVPIENMNVKLEGGTKYEKGMDVEARFGGKEKYFPGVVTRVWRDGSCDIRYEDGDSERQYFRGWRLRKSTISRILSTKSAFSNISRI